MEIPHFSPMVWINIYVKSISHTHKCIIYISQIGLHLRDLPIKTQWFQWFGHRGSKSRPGAHRAGALRSAWRVTGEGDQTHVPGRAVP